MRRKNWQTGNQLINKRRRKERATSPERALEGLNEKALKAEIRKLNAYTQVLERKLRNQRGAIASANKRAERLEHSDVAIQGQRKARRDLKIQSKYEGLNAAENAFAEQAAKRHWLVYRNGWPDFACYEPTTKQFLFVEVKGPGDRLSTDQERMCAVLEKIGIQVRIFRPHVPGALIHWRKYQDPTLASRTRASSHLLPEENPESTGGPAWSARGPEAGESGRVH